MRQRSDFILPKKSLKKTSVAKISAFPPVVLSIWTHHCPARSLQLTFCFVAGAHLNAALHWLQHALLERLPQILFLGSEDAFTAQQTHRPTCSGFDECIRHRSVSVDLLQVTKTCDSSGAQRHNRSRSQGLAFLANRGRCSAAPADKLVSICPSPGLISIIWITSLKHKKVSVKDFPSCFCCAPYNNFHPGPRKRGKKQPPSISSTDHCWSFFWKCGSEPCWHTLPWMRRALRCCSITYKISSSECWRSRRHCSDCAAESKILLCCRYLVKNSASLFNASDYEVAPPEYHRKAV